jgi:hypothetical protein
MGSSQEELRVFVRFLSVIYLDIHFIHFNRWYKGALPWDGSLVVLAIWGLQWLALLHLNPINDFRVASSHLLVSSCLKSLEPLGWTPEIVTKELYVKVLLLSKHPARCTLPGRRVLPRAVPNTKLSKPFLPQALIQFLLSPHKSRRLTLTEVRLTRLIRLTSHMTSLCLSHYLSLITFTLFLCRCDRYLTTTI